MRNKKVKQLRKEAREQCLKNTIPTETKYLQNNKGVLLLAPSLRLLTKKFKQAYKRGE